MIAFIWISIALLATWFVAVLARDIRRHRHDLTPGRWLSTGVIGFVTNFFDVLGIGCFAPQTALLRFMGQISDRKIPGTLNVANTRVNYANAVIADLGAELMQDRQVPFNIRTETRMLYNPQLKGAYNFVPGVMAMVLLLVCTMMTALTVVREKELGTMEVMLVSPIRPMRIIIAKAVPYLLLSFLNIASILLLSTFVLDVPIRGSLGLLFAESVLFTLVSLALGLLISSATASQQSAMFISLVGMFLPTVMLSGFMFPIEVANTQKYYIYGRSHEAIKNGEIFRAIINGQAIKL
jgi:ABC-type multidrug transport system permease subunit